MLEQKHESACECNPKTKQPCCGEAPLEMLPVFQEPVDDEPCCGPPAGPPANPNERPGYILCDFVQGFMNTPAGLVPQISTRLSRCDHLGTIGVRLGFRRNDYKVAPGLYAVGHPDGQAPVLVTANYKLSFDHLRYELGGVDCWLLVLDTRGINVWCAAGKGTFGTDEIIRQVQRTRLAQIVEHRKIILPQLGAPGVAAQMVKRGCGFEVVWGPVRARDVQLFLAAGQKADDTMRRVTFSLVERLVLVPVEITMLGKSLLWTILAIFVLSGLGGQIFSLSAALERGALATMACLVGIATGCVVVPILLPLIPGRAFALKGAIVGLAAGLCTVVALSFSAQISLMPALALILFATAVSSYLAMNFTGTTPFTSPSGVEKEMRRAIPLQLAMTLLAVGLWVGAGFA